MSKLFDLDAGREVEAQPSHKSPTGNPEVQLSEELLNTYDSARQTWAAQAHEDDLFRNNVQWNTDDQADLEERAQMAVARNVIHPAVEQAKAMLTANKPRFSATGREDSDTKVAKLFADILTYIWDISTGNSHLKIAVDDYYVRGMGAMMVYSDPNADNGKGEVYIRSLDPFDVFIDPNAKDIFCRDAAHIIVHKRVTGEQFQRMYPKYKQLLVNAKQDSSHRHPQSAERMANEDQQIGTDIQDMRSSFYALIHRFSRVTGRKFHFYDRTSKSEKVLTSKEAKEFLAQPALEVTDANGQVTYVTAPNQIAPLMDVVAKVGPYFHSQQSPIDGQVRPVAGSAQGDPNAVPGSELLVKLLTIKDLVAMKLFVVNVISVPRIMQVSSIGGELMGKVELPIEDHPVILLMNRHNRNPYPLSDVRFAKPLQEYLNKMNSLIMAHTANATNVKVFLPRGGVNKKELEREWAKAGSAMIEYDPEIGIPIIAGPVPHANELYASIEQIKRDIQDLFGIYSMQQGDPQGAPNTFRGTVALEEFGQRRIKSKKDDIEAFLNQVAKIVVQFVQATWTEEKTIRLVQPNEMQREATLNQPIYDQYSEQVIGLVNDITVGKYDVVVVSGSTLPSNRWAQLEVYMQLFQVGIIDQMEVLKKTEVFDIEGVLQRSSMMAKMAQQIESLTEEVKRLSGDLQTAERAEVFARKQSEIERFKRKIGEVGDRWDKAEQLYEQRLSDNVKMQKQTLASKEQT